MAEKKYGGLPCIPCSAFLGIIGWHSVIWQPVNVVGETPKRYRIEAAERIKLAGRSRWLEKGQTALVPKTAIRYHEPGDKNA